MFKAVRYTEDFKIIVFMQNSFQVFAGADVTAPAALCQEDFQLDPSLQAHSQASREGAQALDAGADLPASCLGNVVHRLAPVLVMDSVNRGIARLLELQRIWLKRDELVQAAHDADVAANLDSPRPAPPTAHERCEQFRLMLAEQTDRYARVQVVQLGGAANKFILVYGDTDPATAVSGTGPFKTFEDAASWYYRGGR